MSRTQGRMTSFLRSAYIHLSPQFMITVVLVPYIGESPCRLAVLSSVEARGERRPEARGEAIIGEDIIVLYYILI